ncbi:hypothetical protein B0H19DRAFT_1077117 [Mycena capillaripes]|nr:hypothetical protein B0H19DRAFT_1077117 [Mycena capillaripes]
MTPAIHKILEGARFKIKRLECSAADLASGLKLEHFPSLTHLTISGGGHDLPSITNTALSNASGNSIEKVVVDIQGDAVEDWEYDGLARMDSVLSSAIVMPALQKVDIRMYDLHERVGWDVSKRDMPFPGSPLLSARGVFKDLVYTKVLQKGWVHEILSSEDRSAIVITGLEPGRFLVLFR